MDKSYISEILKNLGISQNNLGTSTGLKWFASGEPYHSHSPVDGNFISMVQGSSIDDYEKAICQAQKAFLVWRDIPAPKRGEVVRQFGEKLREYKSQLGALVSYEMGKSLQEGLGEVQEMIDLCDFAVGLSRQLNGLTMHSERPSHRMYEQYHPLGIVGIITAFNFPVAIWCWNSALAWICGDVCVWKPSEKALLCGIACQKIIADVLKENGCPEGISCLVSGNYKLGEFISKDERIPLVSATGSARMGRIVGKTVSERLGRCLLELGGNNAVIITPNADIKMAVSGVVFGAIGTCGQRCTSTRRLIVHEDIYKEVKELLIKAYSQISIGNPLNEKNHVGPLIDKYAVQSYLNTIHKLQMEGGKLIISGGVLEGEGYESGCYVRPVIAEVKNSYESVQQETFAPILHLIKYKGEVENAIEIQNSVKQGLSSAIMTKDLSEAEKFLSHSGSDCGIANVNIGTSGAEIGGAFGGEKETGGGRECGSDSWKIYMRRQTNTINYSEKLILAQGIKFQL